MYETKRGGVILVLAFAVGQAQTLLQQVAKDQIVPCGRNSRARHDCVVRTSQIPGEDDTSIRSGEMDHGTVKDVAAMVKRQPAPHCDLCRNVSLREYEWSDTRFLGFQQYVDVSMACV